MICMGHISGTYMYVNIEEKVWLLVKKIRTWKDWQGDNLRDVGSDTSVNDSVQTNKNDK
jgi:hypothetical protein